MTASGMTRGPTLGRGVTGGLARKTPGRLASAEKPQKVMTGLPSTT